MPPVQRLEELQDVNKQLPRSALLLSTYGQLQNEVQAGILDHFHHPRPCTWRGSQYKLSSQTAPGKTLPDSVRHALILAGCGFPVEQVPADLRQALLASSSTPSDMRAALMHKAAASNSQLPDGDSSNTQAGTSSSRQASTSGSRPDGDAAASSSSDADSTCSTWAAGFELLCHTSMQLQLPLAMFPALPLPEQHSFLDFVKQLGCPMLSAIVIRHRQYLEELVREWPEMVHIGWLDPPYQTGMMAWQGCINAKAYQLKGWQMPDSTRLTALAVDCSQPQNRRLVAWDIPSTAGRVKELLSCTLRLSKYEMPWLCKDGRAGVVLAGGAVGACMVTPAGSIVINDLDFFIIAPDEESYTNVEQQVRTWLDKALGQGTHDPKASGTKGTFAYCWVWEMEVREQHTKDMLGLGTLKNGMADREASRVAAATTSNVKLLVKVVRWPYCSPAAVVRSCDIPSVAAWFDGEEVFLDERCAWSHANRTILADPFFDAKTSMRFCSRLLRHASRLPGYTVLIPGPLASDDFDHIVDGVTALLTKQNAGSKAVQRQGGNAASHVTCMLKAETDGIARWALLLAVNKAVGYMPKREAGGIAGLKNECSMEQHYRAAVAAVTRLRQNRLPFSGFLRPPWGGADIAAPLGTLNACTGNCALLGDANTWFNGDALQELPRRVWLAANNFVDYET